MAVRTVVSRASRMLPVAAVAAALSVGSSAVPAPAAVPDGYCAAASASGGSSAGMTVVPLATGLNTLGPYRGVSVVEVVVTELPPSPGTCETPHPGATVEVYTYQGGFKVTRGYSTAGALSAVVPPTEPAYVAIYLTGRYGGWGSIDTF